MVAIALSARRPWLGLMLGALVVLTLATVAWLRAGGPPDEELPAALWQRSLHFQDRANGDIGVVDARTGQEVARFAGEQGFMRGALRALVRERMRRGLGPEQPFELIGHAGGRLTLRDAATGMRINLESFGPSNVAVFSRLRDASPPDRPLPGASS